MVITSLEQGKKPELVRVFLDGAYAATINVRSLIEFHLYKDKYLSAEAWQEIIKKDLFTKLYLKALGQISRRPRSEAEMQQYLSKKCGLYLQAEAARDDLAKQILSRLKEEGHVDDAKFAEWWINERLSFRQKSRMELTAELQAKRIPREIIELKLRELLSTDQEIEMIKKILDKKYGLERLKILLNEQKSRVKINQFLFRKGYRGELIRTAIESMVE